MNEIPFWVHDRPKWVSGITKSTTCADVLSALVSAERRSKAGACQAQSKRSAREDEARAREVSRSLALVEQWRGVERPLSNTSRILKLWLAWGEERSQVRFVVKRISAGAQAQSQAHGAAAPVNSGTTPRTRKLRRRNSRASAASDLTKKATDTVHPAKVLKNAAPSSSSTGQSGDLEKLMRLIISQGETIHWQLRKLQEREGQIETIEHEVHDTRTKTAGKDYLLNAYLKDSPQKKKAQAALKSDAAIGEASENLKDVLEALSRLVKINDQLAEQEEQAQALEQQLSVSAEPMTSTPNAGVGAMTHELQTLRAQNDSAGAQIDYNRHLITTMQQAYEERQAFMTKLEKDMEGVEHEGQRLASELKALQDHRREATIDFLMKGNLSNLTDFDLDSNSEEEPVLFADAAFLQDLDEAPAPGTVQQLNSSAGHYTTTTNVLSSEQLYQSHPHSEPSALYDELQRRLRLEVEYRPDANRINATGSPGSASSSGNSSGSGASYESKSVRFSDRELILSTPELPDLPAEQPPKCKQTAAQQQSRQNKSILKAGENGASTSSNSHQNEDSNSDTGLSSLHSSSDEGTYVLDTLV